MWPNRSSSGAPFGILSLIASSFSPPVPVILTFPPTQPQLCGRSRSEQVPGCTTVRPSYFLRSACAAFADHGLDCVQSLHGQQDSDRGVRHVQARQHSRRCSGTQGRHARLRRVVIGRKNSGNMSRDDILLEAEMSMEKSVDYMMHEFAAVRTGKASPALVENIDVHAYGSTMKLKQLALITTPESRLLVVQPFDAATVADIERALKESK